MKLHILGVCGTFMGGLAALAREAGDCVEGSDQNVYPPMSTQLASLGVTLHGGYAAAHIGEDTELVLVGNALSRGNPAVEHVLDAGLDYQSGPEWLARRVLRGRTVLAVAGTHGKTTTSSLLAWLLDAAGGDPGFLIGGVPANFGVSARQGTGAQFVVEADEYDTAFFDKRSKFVHYRPRVAILNNLEYDHADIFPDLAAIQRQFHHLVRTVPGRGRLVVNGEDAALREVLAMGCWTPVTRFAIDPAVEAEWRAELESADGSAFRVLHQGQPLGRVAWSLLGRHNVMNALAALAAADAVGTDVRPLLARFGEFGSVARRMQTLVQASGVTVYDDFAHHPTAIATTLSGLRARAAGGRILAVLEPRSNSMRTGAHAAALAPSLAAADRVYLLQRPGLPWDAQSVIQALGGRGSAHADVEALLGALSAEVRAGDQVVFMSNGGFDAAPHRFAAQLTAG